MLQCTAVSTYAPWKSACTSTNQAQAITMLIKSIPNASWHIDTIDRIFSNWNRAILWSAATLPTITILASDFSLERTMPIFCQRSTSITNHHTSTCPRCKICFSLLLVLYKCCSVAENHFHVRVRFIDSIVVTFTYKIETLGFILRTPSVL